MLLAAVSRGDFGAGAGEATEEDGAALDHAAREHKCWVLLVEARAAYLEWSSARRAREQGQQQGRLPAGVLELRGVEGRGVRGAALKAVEALERILTFQVGTGCWGYMGGGG